MFDAYCIYQGRKAASGSGGTATSGSWFARELSDETADTGSLGSLSANQVTLGAGTYFVRAWAYAHLVDTHALRVYDTTNTAVLASGLSMRAETSRMGSIAFVEGRFTLAGSAAIELQHQVETTRATDGLGDPAGPYFTVAHELYAHIEFWREGDDMFDAYAIYLDSKASGTDGGTATSGSWETRTLNTEHADAGSIGTLASNQVTLAAGTYYVHASCPMEHTNESQVRLYDATNTAVLLTGTSVACADVSQVVPMVAGRITLAGTAAIELQQQVRTTKATVGMGRAVGGTLTTDSENYAQVQIFREA